MKEHLSERIKQENRRLEGSNHSLTTRETEILEMVTAGYSNARIAEELRISPHTVKTHIHNICKKIKAPGRLQAALWAVKNL